LSYIDLLKNFNFAPINSRNKNKMSTTFLIISRTGLIGKTIHNMFSKRGPQLKILIGTRQKDMIPNHIQIDVNNLETFESLKKHSINVMIVCTKDANNHVLNYAVKHKIDHIDITKPSNKSITIN